MIQAKPPERAGAPFDPFAVVFEHVEPGRTRARVALGVVPDGAGGEGVGAPPAFARVVGPDGEDVRDARFLRWLAGSRSGLLGAGEGGWSRLDATAFDRSCGPGDVVGFVEVFGARAADGEPLGAAFRALSTAPDVVVPLAGGVTVEGVVEGPPDASLRGTLVRARPVRWDATPLREDLCVASARVGAGGEFRLSGLGPEPYRLTVAAPPGLALSGGSVLAPPGGGRLTLRLVPGK